MTLKVLNRILDDLDGSEPAKTVQFALDGTDYEIDLNSFHAGELRKVLARYLNAGRRVRSDRSAGMRVVPTTAGHFYGREIRTWAIAQGIELKGRGRLPRKVIDEFQAANEL